MATCFSGVFDAPLREAGGGKSGSGGTATDNGAGGVDSSPGGFGGGFNPDLMPCSPGSMLPLPDHRFDFSGSGTELVDVIGGDSGELIGGAVLDGTGTIATGWRRRLRRLAKWFARWGPGSEHHGLGGWTRWPSVLASVRFWHFAGWRRSIRVHDGGVLHCGHLGDGLRPFRDGFVGRGGRPFVAVRGDFYVQARSADGCDYCGGR